VTGAADIAVNSAIVGDTNLIAAASNTESVPGGNGNAVAITDIQHQLLMSGGSATVDDFYSGLVSDVGRFVSQAQTNSDHQSMVSSQLATYREEVSGVNMDEEMVNMVQFQSAYSAAAKLVTTVDKMLDTLISMV
jgi:flagellar hook-associated protein 1